MKTIQNMHKNAAKGFTLIELMIVVAIIGILAAVALPAYSDYLTRARVSEIVLAASTGRTSVSEYYASTGTLPDDATQAGINVDQTSLYLASLTYVSNAGNPVITAAGSEAAITAPVDIVLDGVVDPDSDTIAWECQTEPDNFRFVPANCRNDSN